MKSKKVLSLIIAAVIFAYLGAILYTRYQQWERMEDRKKWISGKIGAIKEGMDENAVIEILGQPDSVAVVSADEPGNILKGKHKNVLRYRYDIFLGKLKYTVEGASWAGISVYFDEQNKRVIYVRSMIF